MKTIDVARGQQSQSGSSPTADSPLSNDAASFASRTQSWSSATASNSGSMSQKSSSNVRDHAVERGQCRSVLGREVRLQQCQGLVEEHSWKEHFQVGKDLHPYQHWSNALGVRHGQVNMVKKKIYMYDSMGGSGMSYLESIFQYIQDEYAAKNRGAPLPDIDELEVVGRPLHVKIVNQENGELLLLPLCEWTVVGCVL